MDEIDLHFPMAGVDVSMAFCKQPNRPAYDGKYARTSPRALNVRARDADGRYRGAMRPGLVKFVATRPGDQEWITQDLCTLVTTGIPDPGGGSVQPSQSGRLVLLVATSAGNVYTFPAGGTVWTAATNSASTNPPLNATGLVRSTVNNQLQFFADGTHAVYYDPVTDEVLDWTLTDGIYPADADGNLPRLICTWRGRIVLSGLLRDPGNWFMSKVSDPFDFNYAPDVPVPADAAIAGNVAQQGKPPDVITALIPYSDDILILGMDHSIALFRGDPNYGGAIDHVTDSIGIAWGQAWCMDPSGVVYFFSNRTGIFGFVPGNQPQRISTAIDPILLTIDTGLFGIRMIWNDKYQGLHVFVTLLMEPQDTQHFFWEAKANAWWIDTFVDPNMNPLCCVAFDGNLQEQRVALLGGWDGYVRSIDSDATDDDGEVINSEVWIGPFLTAYNDSVMLKELQAVMASDSGDVAMAVYVGQTAEEALDSTPVVNGTWSAGRNLTNLVRRAAYASYVQMLSVQTWAMESIRCIVDPQGKVRRRGKSM